jgi:hypothetical protein
MKTIIEMTRELGGFAPTAKFLEAFAALVRADEREACAVICDNRVLYTGYDCAAAIRSRDVYKMGWPIGDPRDILKSAKLKEKNT